MNILSILAEKKIIDEKDISSFEEEAASTGKTIDEVLMSHDISAQIILDTRGEYFQIPARIIEDAEISHDVLKYIPEESALHYKFVPIDVKDGVLEVGIVDPDNMEALDALNFISTKVNLPFKIFLILDADFRKVIEMYKGLSGEVGRALEELDTDVNITPKKDTAATDLSDVKVGKKEAGIQAGTPVTKIVATMLRYAVEGNASDIHIEPGVKNVRVRFRLDGVLNTSIQLPLQVLPAVVARIKILSLMKLDEKRKPQDGRFTATIDDRKVDFRVSTFPASHGEKVVMRILDRSKQDVSLEALGFDKNGIGMVKKAIEKPYGMVLISGPTGSGKSTTLYAMLNEVDRDTKNVISLEDPVEYDIKGMNQSQVRPEIGYTFASGLRSILRQDPDIIMVGEIRDKETAQLAIQAALTGHLVFSTIHTNTAVGVVPRLIDMGVDPYLIAPTLVLVMAQRLVRTLCPGTGRKIPVEGSIKERLDKQFADLPEKYRNQLPKFESIYGIEPTPECPNGTRGRTGVFEFLEITKEIEQSILKSGGEKEIEQLARQNGMLNMKEDALIKSLEGKIPFEEVNALGGGFTLDPDNV